MKKMGLFGQTKPADPKTMVNDWCKKIRKEGYGLDRQIRQIQRSEQAAVKSIKEAAKKGDPDSARILAKEVVRSRKAVTKIYTAKANLSSVEMQMKGQAAQLRVAGSLSRSTEVMKAMQHLVRVPEIQKTMSEMSKEMMKAGIIEEMMEDAIELGDDEELEEDVQLEVDKIISEITAGKQPARAPTIDLPEPSREELGGPEEEEEEPEEDLEEMQSRLQALRS